MLGLTATKKQSMGNEKSGTSEVGQAWTQILRSKIQYLLGTPTLTK